MANEMVHTTVAAAASPPGERHPGGRPRLEFDLRQVADLGRIQATHSELAAVLGCHVDTVYERLKHDTEFSEAYKKGLETGKSSLRRLQWKSAMNGNTAMLIWLGKQYLGQTDRQATELTGKGGGSIKTETSPEKVAEIARAVKNALAAAHAQRDTEMEW